MKPIDILKTTEDPELCAKAAKDLIREILEETGCDFIFNKKLINDEDEDDLDDINKRMLKRFKTKDIAFKIKMFEYLQKLVEKIKKITHKVSSYTSFVKDFPIPIKHKNILAELVEDAYPMHLKKFNFDEVDQGKKTNYDHIYGKKFHKVEINKNKGTSKKMYYNFFNYY